MSHVKSTESVPVTLTLDPGLNRRLSAAPGSSDPPQISCPGLRQSHFVIAATPTLVPPPNEFTDVVVTVSAPEPALLAIVMVSPVAAFSGSKSCPEMSTAYGTFSANVLVPPK